MAGYVTDIEQQTARNHDFRRVLFTAPHCQLVVMSIAPGGDIGQEKHAVDQFIRIEHGEGEVVMNGQTSRIGEGTAFVIPSGTEHNVFNKGKGELQLYTIYAPPQHRDGTIHKTRADADRDEEDHT